VKGTNKEKTMKAILELEILPLLPLHIAELIKKVSISHLLHLEEIRMRPTKPLMFIMNDQDFIMANYGLSPKLGKYHRTFCPACNYVAEETPPVKKCPICNNEGVTLGVLDRITFIADLKTPVHPKHRPLYNYQIPLEFIPGIGKKTIEKLLLHFGTEMTVIHDADVKQLTEVVGEQRAESIILAREGKLDLKVGGGGFYGKVVK
jgi:uncharacterized protein (TIGR00375 family)